MATAAVPMSGWVQALGMTIAVEDDVVVSTLTVTPQLLDGAGELHHGVIASVVETVASVAAALHRGERGQVVGVANHTDTFLAVRSGELRATATAVDLSEAEQLWRVDLTDAEQNLVAMGQVRMANLTDAARLG